MMSLTTEWKKDKKYIKAIITLPCCGCFTTFEDVCAHHSTVHGSGIGTKAPDWETIPLCHKCHMDIHGQNKLGLFQRQKELILRARKTLIRKGLIEDEYPPKKDFI